MRGKLLVLSLGTNVFLWKLYRGRCTRFEQIVEQQVNLGYRVNSLLLEHDLVPDRIILDMLEDLGIR